MSDHPPDTTIVDIFWRNASRYGPRPALRRKAGEEWEVTTWDAYAERVRHVAGGLIRLGLAPGDRVGVLSTNRLEWHLADLGILAAGGVTVPVYPTNSSSQVAYVLGHSGCRFLFVEDLDQLSKVLLRRDELPDLQRVFVFDRGEGLDHDFVGDLDDLDALSAEELAEHPSVLEDRARAIHADDLATIVYTSGTTGRPKGAMLTHGNVAANIDNITSVVPIGPDDRFLSFLPLSHIAERTVSDFGEVLAGGETWFAESLAAVQETCRRAGPPSSSRSPACGRSSAKACARRSSTSTGPSARSPSATCTSPPARGASPAPGPPSRWSRPPSTGPSTHWSGAPSAPSWASTRPASSCRARRR